MLEVHPASAGRRTFMTAKLSEQEEYEVQVRSLLRIISVCTLGLWAFAAGLLIGTFLLF